MTTIQKNTVATHKNHATTTNRPPSSPPPTTSTHTDAPRAVGVDAVRTGMDARVGGQLLARSTSNAAPPPAADAQLQQHSEAARAQAAASEHRPNPEATSSYIHADPAQVREAARRVQQGARDIRHRLGRAADDVRRRVERGLDRVEDAVDDVRERVNDGVDQVRRGAERVADGVRDTAERVADGVRDTAERVADGVRDVGRDIGHAADTDRLFDDLGPGDKRTIGTGFTAGAGGRVGQDAKMEVQRNDDGSYSVALDGENLIGVGGGFGSRNVGVGVAGNADARGGGRIEYRFATRADAERGTRLLLQQSAWRSRAAISANPSLEHPSHSPEDVAFLRRHIHATELRGAAAGDAAASLGINTGRGDHIVGGATGGGAARRNFVLRTEYQDGQPSAVVVRHETQRQTQAGAGLSFNQSDGNGGSAGSGGLPVVRGSTQETVRYEERYPVHNPGEGVEQVDLPLEALRGRLGQPERSVRLTTQTDRQVMGDGNGVQQQVDIDLGRGPSLSDAEREYLLHRGPDRVVRDHPDADVHMTQRQYETDGFDFNPGGALGPFSGSYRLTNQTQDFADEFDVDRRVQARDLAAD